MINFQSKSTKQAVLQKTKQSTKQMEEETKKMESRLQDLKLAMENERQQRTQSGNPGFWSRGQSGALANYKAVSAGAKKPAPPTSGVPAPLTQLRKVKLIKDEPLDLPDKSSAATAALPGTLAYLARTEEASLQQQRRGGGGGGGSGAGGRGANGGAAKCGQCEDRPAAVLCPECAEDYCARCFAAFHLKGALRKHRSLPLSAVTTPRQSLSNSLAASSGGNQPGAKPTHPPVFDDPSRQVRRNMVRQLLTSTGGDEDPPSHRSDSGPSLLAGRVDERENAAEFQRALAEWRSGGGDGSQRQQQQQPSLRKKQPPQPQRRPAAVSHGTGTDDGDSSGGQHQVEIKFTSSLSYAEQILLQKHRRAEVGKMPSYRGGSGSGSNSEVFEQIRGMQRQLTNMDSPRSGAADDAERFVARTNRTQVDDLFPESTPRSPPPAAQVGTADPSPDNGIVPPLQSQRPPSASGSGAGAGASTPRRSGLEWQARNQQERKASHGRAKTPRSARTVGRLTAAPSGALSGVAALMRASAVVDSSAAAIRAADMTGGGGDPSFLGGFLLMGVDAGNNPNARRNQGNVTNVWSTGDSRPSSAASTQSSRPTSAARLSNRFYALSGMRSWHPETALHPATGLEPDQLRRTRAEADRFMTVMTASTAAAAAETSALNLRLEDVEIESEARVVAAMPLSRPVSARAERVQARRAAGGSSRPGTAASLAAIPATREELDVTADYLQDDVEHLSRLAVELAEEEANNGGVNGDSDSPDNDTARQAETTRANGLVNRELTQEEKEKQLQDWDDNDMEQMDTARYDDREDVRQLH